MDGVHGDGNSGQDMRDRAYGTRTRDRAYRKGIRDGAHGTEHRGGSRIFIGEGLRVQEAPPGPGGAPFLGYAVPWPTA